jgi:hypothetical protein
MAIYAKRVVGGNGINYTYECDNSGDHASIANSTYFRDLSDDIIYYKDGSGVVLSIFSAEASITQANQIYVDSVNGVDATGLGQLTSPYLTIEYALADITNTGTVSVTTATSYVLSAISDADNANLVVGQYITGTGISYGSIIVSKGNEGGDANTVTLSIKTTASATVTGTWWSIYNVICIGDFAPVSTICKQGFWIDAQTYKADITFGAINLLQFSDDWYIPQHFYLWNVTGTSTSSVFMRGIYSAPYFYANTQDVYLTFNNFYSAGTSYQLGDASNSMSIINFHVTGKRFDARFGYANKVNATNTYWRVDYTYGLLGGHIMGATIREIYGDTVCPTSVTAIASATNNTIHGNITGNVTGATINVYGNISCVLLSVTSGANYIQSNIYGNVTGSVTNGGELAIWGMLNGSLTNSGTYNQFTNAILYKSVFGGTITVTNGSVSFLGSNGSTSSSIIVVNGGFFYNQGILYTGTITIGAGILINKDELYCGLVSYTGAGKIINDGVINTSQDPSATVGAINIINGGTLVNNGGIKWNRTDRTNTLISKSLGYFINNGFMYNPYGMYVKYVVNTIPEKDITLGWARSNGNTVASSTTGTGSINRLAITTANTDTSLDIDDGVNLVSFNVTGAGKSKAVIGAELALLINASILLFQGVTYNTLYGYLLYVTPNAVTISYTSLVNIGTSGSYGGAEGYAGNILGGGSELVSSDFTD